MNIIWFAPANVRSLTRSLVMPRASQTHSLVADLRLRTSFSLLVVHYRALCDRSPSPSIHSYVVKLFSLCQCKILSCNT